MPEEVNIDDLIDLPSDEERFRKLQVRTPVSAEEPAKKLITLRSTENKNKERRDGQENVCALELCASVNIYDKET